MDIDSRILFDKFKNGDKKAFECIFYQYYSILCLFALKFLKDKARSEDVVQEVFSKVWEIRKNFYHIEALKTYLYNSTKNQCINILKREQAKLNYLNYKKGKDIEESIITHIIEEETHRLIFAAIAQLPPQCKKITHLSIEGLKNKEIAEKLKISLNTVKTQKKIAYKILKTKLANYYLLAYIAWLLFTN